MITIDTQSRIATVSLPEVKVLNKNPTSYAHSRGTSVCEKAFDTLINFNFVYLTAHQCYGGYSTAWGAAKKLGGQALFIHL